MIHRVNSVAPDLDDRVIKPNQARDAKNLRFGASTDDSNMSGGVMVNGNEYISNRIPDSGVSKVIGVLADLELQTVYFCLYNSEERHGIYRIRTVNGNDLIELIIGGTKARGAWLKFSSDMQVSMTSIDGKLYWTDGVNQPRMINIQKGVSTELFLEEGIVRPDMYPPIPEEWQYTQIKRAPQELLKFTIQGIVPKFSTADASKDFTDIFKEDDAYQFSYYYIYDNNEESRIAPITETIWYSISLTLSIPEREFVSYIKNISLIKKVVFIYRIKNSGEWNIIKTVNNDDNFSGSILIDDIKSIPSSPVSSNITSNYFDSVPRISATNEIAQNRINHGNYLIDYPKWDGLELKINVVENPVETIAEIVTLQRRVRIPLTNIYTTVIEQRQVVSQFLQYANRTFYMGFYNVGIELLDEWGRRISVVNEQKIEIPNYSYLNAVYNNQIKQYLYPVYNNPNLSADQDANKCYKIEYTVSGQFPSWCKYWRIVYSKNQSVNYFYKSICRLYYWYNDGINDYLSVLYGGNGKSDQKIYTLKGIAIEISSGEPFLFNSSEQQYVKISKEYLRDATTFEEQPLQEYKIKKSFNNLLFIEDIVPTEYPGWVLKSSSTDGYKESDYTPLYYQVYLYSKKQNPEQFYYQSTDVKMVGDPNTGYLYGDCYLNAFKKQTQGITRYVLNFTGPEKVDNSEPEVIVSAPTRESRGYAISMNIRDIYSQDWISDIGQINIVNENQKEVYIKNGICFSDTLIAGTQINGLSKFDPLDVRQAPLENGPITALVTTNATQREPGVMLAIGTYGVSSFYYDSVQLTNVDGMTNIAVSDRYLASQRPLQGQFGCSQLSSVTKTPLAAVYWWSDVINDFIRYSNAGLERLGLTYMFGNKLRNEVAGKKVATVYDYITDEVILMPSGSASFVFSERYKTFQGMREYEDASGDTPERGISISQRMYHFIKGMPWVTTVNTPKSSFFGTVKNPELVLVTNESPAVVKQWNQVKVYGPKPANVILTSGDAEGFYRQSYIKPGWWIQRKGEYDAAIRRDITSGDVMTGKIMESRILYSTFVFNPQAFEKLNFIEIKSNMSVVQ